MKKQVALLTTALLATSFVLGATSCASKDVSKALKSASYSENTTAVSALTKDDNFNEVDNAGLMVVSKFNKETVNNVEVKIAPTYAGAYLITEKVVDGKITQKTYEEKCEHGLDS